MIMNEMDYGAPRFLSQEQAQKIETQFGSPVYVYSEEELETRADEFLSFPNAYWLKVEYAMKANPNMNILKLFSDKWIGVDASSEYEVYRALNAWVPANTISLVTQEPPRDFERIANSGISFIATSLLQVELAGKYMNGWSIWVRLNPWMWCWFNAQNNTWWVDSSFGIWFEDIGEIKRIAEESNLTIKIVHLHIWSENTTESWLDAANLGFDFLKNFPDADSLDLWGGFKMWIMPYEKTADLQAIWTVVKRRFEEFYEETGRKIKLIVEPWKYLSINACSFVSKIVDIVSTEKDKRSFIKINSWMNDMPRVPMYGVQEPIYVMNDSKEKQNYVVVGHCCETGDVKSAKLYKAWEIEERLLNTANVWDLVVIDWVGAYNSSMSMKNYNSFPESGELMLRKDWTVVEIRKRQKLEDIWKNEISVV